MSFHIDCAERACRTQVLTCAAADAAFGIDNGYFGGLRISGVRSHHLYGADWAVAGAVAALHLIGDADAILLYPYGMTYLDENGVRYPSRRWALWELGIDDYALVAALRQKGIDVSGEIRTMCGTKDAAALDEAMEAFKKEKLKAFIPGEK